MDYDYFCLLANLHQDLHYIADCGVHHRGTPAQSIRRYLMRFYGDSSYQVFLQNILYALRKTQGCKEYIDIWTGDMYIAEALEFDLLDGRSLQ